MPGFFGNQSNRLQRERWADASELADELFAMFGADTPLEADVPITLVQRGDTPAITVVNEDGDIITTIGGGGDGGGGGGGTVENDFDPTEIIRAIQRLNLRIGGVEQFLRAFIGGGFTGVIGGQIASGGTDGVYSVTFDTDQADHSVQQLHFNNDGPPAPAGMKVIVNYYQEASQAIPTTTDSNLGVEYFNGSLPQWNYTYFMLYPTWQPAPEVPP